MMLIKELHHSLRRLSRAPGFALVSVLTLALGIGATTAIYSMVRQTLQHALPYHEPERLVHLWETTPASTYSQREASYPDYVDWRDGGAEVFEAFAGYSLNERDRNLTGRGPVQRIRTARVTGNFFSALGTTPLLGRLLIEAVDEAVVVHEVVLSHQAWRDRFGADPGILGETLVLNDEAHVVVGVLPSEFQFAKTGDVEAWVPLNPTGWRLENRHSHWIHVFGRLRSGVTLPQARTAIEQTGRRIAETHPESHAGSGVNVVWLQDEVTGPIRAVLLIMLGAVGFVLLIVGANLTNLFLVRSVAREKEMAVRLALGASRASILRTHWSESLWIGVLGGVVGLFVAVWGVVGMIQLVPETLLGFVPYLRDLAVDWRVGMAGFGLSVLVALVIGLVPGIAASRLRLSEGLQSGGRVAATVSGRRFSSILSGSQIALALVMLAGCGLALKSLGNLLAVDPGFAPEHVLTMAVNLSDDEYSERNRLFRFYDDVFDRVGRLPGVQGVTAVSKLPLDGGGNTVGVVDRERALDPEAEVEANVRTIGRDYFGVARTPLIRGRVFTDRDEATSAPVVIVNELLVQAVFGAEDPVGRRLVYASSPEDPPREIVGVVANENVTSLEATPSPVIYLPLRQSPLSSMSLMVRTTGAVSPGAWANPVRNAIHSVDSNVPVFRVRTMDAMIAESPPVFLRRAVAWLIGWFGLMAVILAAVGVFGVVAHVAAQRTREFGIRLALGAGRSDLLILVLGRGLRICAFGIVAGLACSVLVSRSMEGLLFHVSPHDPFVLAAVCGVLLIIGLAACWLPARRASRVHPIEALRCE